MTFVPFSTGPSSFPRQTVGGPSRTAVVRNKSRASGGDDELSNASVRRKQYVSSEEEDELEYVTEVKLNHVTAMDNRRTTEEEVEPGYDGDTDVVMRDERREHGSRGQRSRNSGHKYKEPKGVRDFFQSDEDSASDSDSDSGAPEPGPSRGADANIQGDPVGFTSQNNSSVLTFVILGRLCDEGRTYCLLSQTIRVRR